MRTFLIILGIWLLLNALFVVVMMPARKPSSRGPGGLLPVAINRRAGPPEEDDKLSFRHAIISAALTIVESVTPPLLEALNAAKGLVSKRHSKPRSSKAPDGNAKRTRPELET
ncbi:MULTISPECIES: hypothetical protein [unclassified Bradyrhizobium]|uniref:hypothetical protein n=1 Tax=unclassified Bradyrhizobium TaxID=2631580 RepID=UPI00247A72E0|nr:MULTISPECIES: hypothetical protein [unclassified Bradyrhizobium]WGR73413.1 hypothetical protein MTX24_11605 [Bradyrhizobium sp. ISRA426]WGR78250.1 hypothetical protein MTX21_36575 [Bradyrhizobium sp. ISRA430]WGR88651.1 hypothetical protein MTX25_11615 [Bradyrhizobium sp. ISRA432]